MSAYFFVAQHGMSQCVSSLPPSAGNFFSDTGIGFFFIRLGFFFSVGSLILRECSVDCYSVFSKLKKSSVVECSVSSVFIKNIRLEILGYYFFVKNVWLVGSF